MDADRQWFKSKYGLPDDVAFETPRDIAICNTVISSGNLLAHYGLQDDSTNPLVEAEPNIRLRWSAFDHS